MKTLILKPEREKSLERRHPWIFSGAVARLEGDPQPGDTVAVRSARGDFLAWAAFSPHSQIQARVWSWNEGEAIEPAFFRFRIERALALRRAAGLDPNTPGAALRLIHAESDGLPGLVVDRYADTLVMQALSAGVEPWREPLADLLLELTGAARLYERSDVDVRRLEGLPMRTGLLRGPDRPDPVEIEENSLRFEVDIAQGHKTGFYLDQRRNRHRVGELASGRDVLDCFCYTGGFSAYALRGGAASVLALDASQDALVVAGRNLALNGLPLDRYTAQTADVFQHLRRLRDSASAFDLIILDPPKFAQTAAQAQRAARGYKDINLLAFKLLRPGGLLFTFSCSGGVDDDLFQKIVAGAAQDAGVDARILERLHQGPDHPVNLAFPEGAYLKGLVVFVA